MIVKMQLLEPKNAAAQEVPGAVLLAQREIPTGTLRERDFRNLFIARASVEAAAQRAELEAYNARPLFGRRR